MQTEAEYQNVLLKQNELKLLVASDNDLAKKHTQATKLIEDHFETALIHLARRKEALLHQLDARYLSLGKEFETYRQGIASTLEQYAKIRETGEMLYGANRDCAVAIWASAKLVPPCARSTSEVVVTLPTNLFEACKTHGSVEQIENSDVKETPSNDAASNTVQPKQETSLYNPLQAQTTPQAPALPQTTPQATPQATQIPPTPPTPPQAPQVPSLALQVPSQAPPSMASILDQVMLYAALKISSVGVPTHNICNTPRLRVDKVTTFAGSKAGLVDGVGAKARMSRPRGIAFNPNTNLLYVCDNGNRAIRTVSLEGQVNLLPWSGARFSSPTGVAIYLKDNSIFITDKTTHTIKQIVSGKTKVFAGTGKPRSKDGPKEDANFCKPSGIAIDQQTGTVYVADKGSHTIRTITPQGSVSTLAGKAGMAGFADGVGNCARFDTPKGIWYSAKFKSVFVCDCGNDILRMVNVNNGAVTTIKYEIKEPHGVIVLDECEVILATSYWSDQIIQIAHRDGTFEGVQWAGSGKQGADEGSASQCSFNYPYGIALCPLMSTCFVTDYKGHAIRALTLDQTINLL